MALQLSFWLLLIAVRGVHSLVFPTAVNAELAFVRPNSSVSCASPQQRPCLTFNEYAEKVDQYFVDNTTFLFLPGTHELDTPLDLEGLSNVSFAPLNDLDAQIHLSPSANITWTNCEDIEISGFVFILSGQYSVLSNGYTELIFHNTSAVLASLTLTGNGTRLFAFSLASSDLQISNLMADGISAPILYASDGSVITFYGHNAISNCNITVNFTMIQASFGTLKSPLAIIYSLIQLDFGSSSYIHGNILFAQNNITYLNPNPLQSIVEGGGTAVSVGSNSLLVVSGTASFVRNQLLLRSRQTNINANGGALFARSGSKVIFEESSNISFIENYSEFYGGAISTVNTNLTVYGTVLFEGNSASYGGAIYVVTVIDILPMNTSIKLKNVRFERNTALDGGAIYVESMSLSASVELRNVWFEGNKAMRNGGAIYAIVASISMTDTLHFIKNSAEQGGAIAFGSGHGSGTLNKLLLTEPLMATFTENFANMSGGVIFFDDNDRPITTSCTKFPPNLANLDCFIQYIITHDSSIDNVSIRLNFTNNNAGIAGRILYGGGLDTCVLPVIQDGSIIYIALKPLNFIKSNVSINNSNNYNTSIVSSDPLQVCICEFDFLRCDRTDRMTVRGKELTLQAVIVGQAMGASPSNVRISLDGATQLGSPSQRIQRTGKTCTNITYTLFSEESTTLMTLFPDNGPCRDIGIGRTLINVTFLPCPNGFNLAGSECVCEERLHRFNASCNVNTNSIEWTSTSNRFWVGAVYKNESTYQGLILHTGCPFDYCVDHPVPITLDNVDIQCDHNHSGTLCGSCKEGYSIALGNLHCLPCSNDYLALILPFALAGIALVIVLLLLRLSVSAGTINGLIFYANIVQANTSFFFPAGDSNILTVFIAWLNLDLGIETCFYDGMTTYAYTWLQFVFPFYVWFLMGLIIVASHYSRKLTKVLGENPMAMLATLFLLSYSKILGTIVAAVASTELEYPHNDSRIVWLLDGNVAYLQTQYLVLVVFAIVILVFLFVPYTLLLFFAHWLQALSHWRIFSWLNKIKPFIDTYHAPYKKQTRYWTGLLLFMRIFLFAFDAINSEFITVVITSITVILMSLAWMHMGVYENYFNNILEAFFIANLCVFATATYYVQTNDLSQAVTANIFIGLAFAAFVCIVLFHVYLVLRETAVWKKIPKPNILKEKEWQLLDNDHDVPDPLVGATPSQTTVSLREPLLEQ